MAFERITFSPQEISEAAISILAPKAKGKGIDIHHVNDWRLPSGLVGDPGRLRQVLINLASNAVKFTNSGSVAIVCRCVDQSDESAEIEWRVTDTGTGIDPGQVDRLFNDFVQADSSINRRFGGTGLGLSICKRIVDQMGGQIGIASTGSGGTTVRVSVRLPIVCVERRDMVKTLHDPTARIIKCIAALGRPLKVLIADDNATNRLVASKILQGFDLSIAVACDGAEAVHAATVFLPDVILMDMRMPEMDGLEATRALRRKGITIPIIAFTANAFQDDMEAAREAGMNAFVSKPVRKPILLDAISNAVEIASRVDSLPYARSGAQPAVITGSLAAPAFDRAEYDTLANAIGADAILEAASVFASDAASILCKLRSSDLKTDRDAIGRAAHALKGAAGALGFKALSETAAALERNAKTVDQVSYIADCSKLEQLFMQAQAFLPSQHAAAA